MIDLPLPLGKGAGGMGLTPLPFGEGVGGWFWQGMGVGPAARGDSGSPGSRMIYRAGCTAGACATASSTTRPVSGAASVASPRDPTLEPRSGYCC
ncbi:hypothetical protein GCM10028786_23700 [Flaviaesturariibacter terrae]